MTLEASRTYRVVQWASGNIGMRSLRAVIEHPKLELVGLYVYSAAKAGRDAGELCGLGPEGIKATRSIVDVIALRPDCVLYMPQGCNFDELCRLLEAGINVVTTRTELNNPDGLEPAIRARIEAACVQGRSSIHATGSSPGFVTEALPLVLTSIQRRLERVRIDEFADLSSRNSPAMLFDVMGFGQPPRPEASVARAQHLSRSFGPSLQLLAGALRVPLDTVEAHGDVATARHDVHIAAGVIAAGTVAAQRTTITGARQGRALLVLRAHWYCTTDIAADWDLGPTGWRLQIDGDSPLDVSVRFPVSPERWPEASPGLTAHRPVNAIPYVCEAAPGIRTIVDLPQIIADLS